jgi:uncharacterized RDD family membrane protein YckC
MNGSPGTGPAVITPDAVGLDLEVASVGSRGTAYVIDALALITGLILLGIGQALLGGAGFVEGWWGIALLLVLAMLWQFGYPVGFETMNHGRTPGKMALGLRVVTVEGAPIGFRHAAIRAMTGLLELLGTFGAIAILTSFTSSRSQRLGDLAAGTLVVRERRGSRSGPQAATFRVPTGLESYVASLDVRALTPADYAAIRETLQRVDHLPPEVGGELTRGLAARLLPRVQPPPPAGVDAPVFLQTLAAAIQARRQPARPAVSGASAASFQVPASPGVPASQSAPPQRAGAAPAGSGRDTSRPAGEPSTATGPGASSTSSAPAPSPTMRPAATDVPPHATGFAPPD